MSQEPHSLGMVAVAKRLGIGRKSAIRLVLAGDLPAIRIGKAYKVRPSDLEAFVARSWVVSAVPAGVSPTPEQEVAWQDSQPEENWSPEEPLI